MTERPPITHVAIRFGGKVWSLPAPNRHHHVIAMIVSNYPDAACVDAYDDDQGFLDASGRYLTRRQALASALFNGQIREPDKVRHRMLFSEDVW
jgi:hypothetical protein